MSQSKYESIEIGHPADDLRMFRRCLGQYGTGVAIITTHKDGQSAGVTVNSVASVSLEPPLVLWSISRGSRSFSLFQNAGGFAINVLSKDQIELSRHFSSKVEDKFLGVPTRSGNLGIPLLEGAVAHLECTLEAAYDGGDHVILVGRVVRFSRFIEEPLLFVQGRYVVAADHPDAPPANTSATRAASAPATEPSTGLIPLLFEAHHALSAKFEDHRRAEGMGAVPARILAALEGNGVHSVEAVARKTYLGIRDAEDTLVDLLGKGQVERSDSGEFCLTQTGRERREAIRRRWLDFQSTETAGISSAAALAASSALTELLANVVPALPTKNG